jgi:hypothetical protein
MSWLDAFLWTLALELPIYAIVIRRALSVRGFFAATLLGNAFTHPIVWNTVLRFSDYEVGLWTMESFAVIAEAGIVGLALGLANRDRNPPQPTSTIARRALLAAVAANAFSAIVGPRLVDLVARL